MKLHAKTASCLLFHKYENWKKKCSLRIHYESSIKFEKGFSHATVRDLSKHRLGDLDKLRDRAGGCMGAVPIKLEQVKIIMNILVIVSPINFPRLLYLCVPPPLRDACRPVFESDAPMNRRLCVSAASWAALPRLASLPS